MLQFIATVPDCYNYFCFMKEETGDLELVLKLPENKPPYIGLLFQSEYKASYINQFYVNEFGGKYYKLVIEPFEDMLSVSLVSKELKLFYSYKVKKYDIFKLQRFLGVAKYEPVNFGHVLMKNDKHYPARTMTELKIWVLTIQKIEFLSEQRI